jgi:hypothetical protein
MSENPDKKGCRHAQNHVANIGLSGQNLATFRRVADMSPTCRRHFQPSWTVGTWRAILQGDYEKICETDQINEVTKNNISWIASKVPICSC